MDVLHFSIPCPLLRFWNLGAVWGWGFCKRFAQNMSLPFSWWSDSSLCQKGKLSLKNFHLTCNCLLCLQSDPWPSFFWVVNNVCGVLALPLGMEQAMIRGSLSWESSWQAEVSKALLESSHVSSSWVFLYRSRWERRCQSDGEAVTTPSPKPGMERKRCWQGCGLQVQHDGWVPVRKVSKIIIRVPRHITSISLLLGREL